MERGRLARVFFILHSSFIIYPSRFNAAVELAPPIGYFIDPYDVD